jgi:hypothetical protein
MAPMNKNPQIMNELQELKLELPMVDTPFLAPEHYFNNLGEEILTFVQSETRLDYLSKKMPGDIPNNYFDSFHQTLMEEIKQENVLDKLPKTMPFSVPNGYFEQLPLEVSKRITPTQKLKPHNFLNRTFSNWSMAAALMAFVFSAFLLVNRNTHVPVENQLSQLSDIEIETYLNEHQTEFEMANLNEVPDPQKIDLRQLEKDIFDQQLNNLTEEEIIDYL